MNMIMYILCFAVLPLLIMGLLGALLGWFLRGRNRGDLSVEGEGALRAEMMSFVHDFAVLRVNSQRAIQILQAVIQKSEA